MVLLMDTPLSVTVVLTWMDSGIIYKMMDISSMRKQAVVVLH